MNRTTALALGIAFLSVSPSAIYANEGMDNMSTTQMVDRHMEHLNKKLNLSTDQQQKIRAILEDETSKMEPLHQQMKTIHDDSDSKINELLSQDQQKKFAEIKEEKKKQMEKMKD